MTFFKNMAFPREGNAGVWKQIILIKSVMQNAVSERLCIRFGIFTNLGTFNYISHRESIQLKIDIVK